MYIVKQLKKDIWKNSLEFEVSEFWKTMINQSWRAKRSQENFEKKMRF